MYQVDQGSQALDTPLELKSDLNHDLSQKIERAIEENGGPNEVSKFFGDTIVQLLTQNKDIPGYKILQALKQMIWTNPVLSVIIFFSNIFAGVYLTYILYKGLRGFVFYGIRSFRKYKKKAIKQYNTCKMGGGGWFSNWFSRLWKRNDVTDEIYIEGIEEGRSDLKVMDSAFNQQLDDLSEIFHPIGSNPINEIQQCSTPDIPFIDGNHPDSRMV